MPWFQFIYELHQLLILTFIYNSDDLVMLFEITCTGSLIDCSTVFFSYTSAANRATHIPDRDIALLSSMWEHCP